LFCEGLQALGVLSNNPAEVDRFIRLDVGREQRELRRAVLVSRAPAQLPWAARIPPENPVLSYRHAFHAGNHADVIKHLVQVLALEYLAGKAGKPLRYIDTHAGPGRIDLHSGFAGKNREFETGIGRLWQRDDLPEPVAKYLAVVRQLNPSGGLRFYPGSPAVAAALLTSGHRLDLFELHPDDAGRLERWAAGDRRIHVQRADGLAALKGLLPPVEKRALVMIDPAYELKSDYSAVPAALQAALRRFATGVYALWYPLLTGSRHSETMIAGLCALPVKYLLAELPVSAPDSGGMVGSGMLVINPPWHLQEQLQLCLPWLQSVLSQAGARDYRLVAAAPGG